MAQQNRRVGIYAAGVVAPGAAHLKAFLQLVENQTPALCRPKAFHGAFLAGHPTFDFEVYRDWITHRHNPSKFSQLADKGGDNVRFAIGTTIDALESVPGLEAFLKTIESRVTICYGTGFGDLDHYHKGYTEFEEASRTWNRFWAHPERNEALRLHLSGQNVQPDAPTDPSTCEVDSPERLRARTQWDAYWATHSEPLKEFVTGLQELENLRIGADVATDKLNVIRAKQKGKKALMDRFGCPTPPWDAVSANMLWNLPNAPGAQVSMLLGIHGVSSASIGACATFGLIVAEATRSIRAGLSDGAIVGTVDLTPPDALIAAFNNAKVLALGDLGTPLCSMRGTHVAGGGCTYILGDIDTFAKAGFHPVAEVLGVGVSSDAEHIITPSATGPKYAVDMAMQDAGIPSSHIDTWDMHATGTPGDFSEFQLIADTVPMDAHITARKGIFGHGMSSCGGWEVAVQIWGSKSLGKGTGRFSIAPSGIPESEIHPAIRNLGRTFVSDTRTERTAHSGRLICGKLSMGIGGVSSCLLIAVNP